MAVDGLVIAMLAAEAVSDIKTKSVSTVRLLIFLGVAAIANIIFEYQPLWSMLGGMAVGGVMFIYAFATRESIGYGDCLVFVCAGAFIGLWKNLRLLFGSFLSAAVAGGIYSAVKHKGMKVKIPFVPCVLGTFLVGVIVGVIM